MADPRTRPYPSATSAHHQNGPSSSTSRERAFNDIFNTGRPPIPQQQQQQHPNSNGNGSTHSPSAKPYSQDPRGYRPPPPIQYQDPVRRSPPARQYSMPNDVNVPPPREQRAQLSPRQHSNPLFDPRMNVGSGSRQVSAPHPQQRIYNDIPPSHQRPPQDYPPPPNGSDYRTKSLTNYNSRAKPPQPSP